jgi:glycosyltransferase involved in cell wall biosynthesis
VKSKEEPFVCVLTPFYNTADYLAECIESVLAQTHQNYEYILVDNQSTDGSGELVARYAEKDSRIRLVRTEAFYSQTQNYNFALSLMAKEAKYCKIASADDWIYPQNLEAMVSLAEANPAVGLISSYDLEGDYVGGLGIDPKVNVMSGRDAAREMLLTHKFFFGSPTTVMYRADVVRARNPFYEENRVHDDTEVAFEILRENDFGFVHQILSYLRPRDESIMGQAQDFTPQTLDRLIFVTRFGRHFLTEQEYETCVKEAKSNLYRVLASRWLKDRLFGRDEKFWEYQEFGLSTIGSTIDQATLARSVASRVLDGVMSPLKPLKLGSAFARR